PAIFDGDVTTSTNLILWIDDVSALQQEVIFLSVNQAGAEEQKDDSHRSILPHWPWKSAPLLSIGLDWYHLRTLEDFLMTSRRRFLGAAAGGSVLAATSYSL